MQAIMIKTIGHSAFISKPTKPKAKTKANPMPEQMNFVHAKHGAQTVEKNSPKHIMYIKKI